MYEQSLWCIMTPFLGVEDISSWLKLYFVDRSYYPNTINAVNVVWLLNQVAKMYCKFSGLRLFSLTERMYFPEEAESVQICFIMSV